MLNFLCVCASSQDDDDDEEDYAQEEEGEVTCHVVSADSESWL